MARSRLLRYGVYVCILSWLFLLLHYFDIFAPHVYTHAPGECDFVKGIVNGSDDIAISRNHGFFVSGGARTPKVYLVSGRKATACKIRGAPYRFAPFGLSIFEDDNHTRLFVVNGWSDGWSRSSTIEVFDVENEGRTLQHVRTVTSDVFNYVNDIYAVSDEGFWFTNSFGTSFPLYYVEFVSRYSGGAVGFYDGKTATLVGRHIPFANGVTMHKDFLYVASTGKKAIFAYKLGDRQIEKLGELPVHCGIDNLNADRKNGDLWVACQPILYQIAVSKLFGGDLASKVLRIQVPSKGLPTPGSITEVYSNAGIRYGHKDGASTAFKNGTDLWIGSAEGRMLHCNLNRYGSEK